METLYSDFLVTLKKATTVRGASVLALSVVLLGASGCDDGQSIEPKVACFPGAVVAGCQPIYPPTFENIHRQTLMMRCAIGGGACHLAAGRQGNLSLEGEDEAFNALMSNGRVRPGEPACSTLSHRISGVHGAIMPPGDGLSPGEVCAINRWIELGAEP